MRSPALLLVPLALAGCSSLPLSSSSTTSRNAFYRVSPTQTWNSLASSVGLEDTHVSDQTLPDLPNLPDLSEMEEAIGGGAEPVSITVIGDREVASRAPSPLGTGDIAWRLPVTEFRISRGFSMRRGSRAHHGIDFAAPRGTAILAAAAGRVIRAGRSGTGYGNWIVIDVGGDVQTIYAHCSRIDVEVGDRIRAGQQLGAVGSSGRSTGPHLHFEVRQSDQPVDPMPLLRSTDSEQPASSSRGT